MKRYDASVIAQMRTLKKQGKTLPEIREETGASLVTISKYTKHIKAENQTEEIEIQKPSLTSIPEQPQNPAKPIQDYDVEFIAPITDPHEALIEVQGIPVNRKISLTPKNLTMWDIFRKTCPQWDGDLSDFINESMDCTFKALKMKMKVTIGDMVQ